MLGKGAGRGFPGHPMLNPSKGTFSMRLLIADRAGVPPRSGTAPTASRGGTGGTVWRKRTPFAPFQKGFFRRVEVGSAPPLGARAGQCASRDPGVPSPLSPWRGFREGVSRRG
jgi:hypothetical protein